MSANEFSYWPTTTTQDAASSSGSNPQWGHGTTLTDASRNWPTINAADAKTSPDYPHKGGNPTLAMASAHWPTPDANAVNDGETPESWQARNARMRAKGINGNGMGLPLTMASITWRTPDTMDCGGASDESQMSDAELYGAKGMPLPRAVRNFSPPDQQTPDGEASSPSAPASRPRLNPAFGCWLMGIPPLWTNPGATSCEQLEMEQYRSQLRSRLSYLLARLD